MIIAVDFDGTIVDHRYPEIGPQVPMAFNWLRFLQDTFDVKYILWTVRQGKELDDAVQYCHKEGVALWGINENPTQHRWAPGPKAYAQIYVDDAALGCPKIHVDGFHRVCVNWQKVGPELEDLLMAEQAKKNEQT